jgi:hypothetical protein
VITAVHDSESDTGSADHDAGTRSEKQPEQEWKPVKGFSAKNSSVGEIYNGQVLQ